MLYEEVMMAIRLRVVEGLKDKERDFLHGLIKQWSSLRKNDKLTPEQVKELDRLIKVYSKDAFIEKYQLDKLKTQRQLA